MYMCLGNQYTISTCGSPTASSVITVTTTTGVVQEFDANSCGTHATVNFTPQISNTYWININAAFGGTPCTAAIPGTLLQITCGQAGCPSPGDDPCGSTPPALCNPNFTPCPPIPGATAFPALGPNCTTLPATTAGATATSGLTPSLPSCGGYPNGGDVWFTANASATGTLALDVDFVGATDLAMAVYSTSGGCTPANLTEVLGGCNGDLIPGVDKSPFVSLSALVPNALYYIRVWPQNNVSNGGNFTLCAYHPVPPTNDNCTAPQLLTVSSTGCVPLSFNTQDATNNPTVIPAGCSTPNNDVWFVLVVPTTGTLNINTLAGSLTDMAMAVYTACPLPGSAPGCGSGNCNTLTLLQCQPGGAGMPTFTPSPYYAGQVLYVRMWSETTGFGTFQICAFMSQPPVNDNPCGAIALPNPLPYGCITRSITTGLALQTPTNQGGATIPNPSCGGIPNNDVWFTAVVPANGQLRIDMDDAQMTNAAAAVYSTTAGCASGSVFTQRGCFQGGSANSAAMPAGSVTGLTPGSTVYIRVWREAGVAGNAYLCAGRTDTPPVVPGVSCYYTLTMNDAGGDGWNGSYVRITVGGVATNYTILSGNGTISFPVPNAVPYVIEYFPVGGFQNQISYNVVSNLGALIYSSTPIPTVGFNAAGNADCNLPPANPADCLGNFRICSSTSTLSGAPGNSGAVADLNNSNRGCLSGGESEGLWYTFSAGNPGTMGFTITPAGYADYDFAVWGPYSSAPSCPTGPTSPPYRCSWAAGGGPTGLNSAAGDFSEGAGGDRFVNWMTVTTGQFFILYVDNWSRNGITFGMSFNGTASPSCTLLPVEFLTFDGRAVDKHVDLDWATGAEMNSSHFIVERSADGINFEAIGRVNAAGMSMTRTDYKFSDMAPLDGVNYYRIQQIDNVGVSTSSRTVNVLFQSGTSLFVFPNPATETLQASLSKAIKGTVRWRILDMSGRQVGEGSLSNSEGITQFTVPVVRLESGSYALEVLEGKGAVVGNVRFVKQ